MIKSGTNGPGFYSYDRMINLSDTIISESFATNHADARFSVAFFLKLCYNKTQRC